MPTILRASLLMMTAAVLFTAQTVSGGPAADACKVKPEAVTPSGGHWYYRVNRADGRRCWYVGAANARPALRRRTAALPATAPPPTASATEAAQDTSAPWATQEIGQPATASAPVMAAQPSFAPQAAGQAQPRLSFAARWPDDLPQVQEPDPSDDRQAPAISSSYAETSARAAAHMPLRWPVVEAAAVQPSAADTALRVFTLAGLLSIAFLVLAGWAAKFRAKAFSRRALPRML